MGSLQTAGRSRAAPRGLLPALAVFACASAFVVQSPGWAQTSYMALSRALSDGTARIDRWHWETHDVAWFEGHYYSVKPPGLVFATYPLFAALDGVGVERVARDARIRGESDRGVPWMSRELPVESYGYDRSRARAAREAIANDAPVTWALGVLGVLVPALVLLVVLARLVERVTPGTGVAAALTLAAGTMVLPFSTLYFSHLLSAALAFGAFALAWREREGPSRPRVLAVAGVLAGLAVVCEYPLAIAALIVGLYAISRRVALVQIPRRAAAYGAGVVAGAAPLLAYQWWAFGSPLHMSYANAVAETGFSGHDVLGLNDGGFFGVTAPRIVDGLSLLVGGRGLLTLTPVLVVAIAGVIALHREGRHRAETRTVIAIAVAYLLYNAGYWLPFGGGSPGPRFLIPILPFIALGLGIAWRRWPAVTLALAAISTTTMVAATMSYPMIGVNDAGEWVRRLVDYGSFQHSVLDLAGIAHGPVAILPFAALVAIALLLGVRTLGREQLALGARFAPPAVLVWALCATVLPRPLQLPSQEALVLIATAGMIGLLAVGVAMRNGRGGARSPQEEEHHASARMALEVETAQRTG
ncbi:MAG: hypothetical protein QOD83_3094 [Solirubrobacteraceae bacterium]|nr:hypothetical protein [Solirubrobacteraceae bacterium]